MTGTYHNEEKNIEENNTIIAWVDMMKIIAAITVVAIHMYPLKSINRDADIFRYLLCTWAVPFFFITSGYFLLKDYGTDICKKRIMKQLVKVGKWYIIWSIVYAPIILVRKILPQGNFMRGVAYELRDFIFMGSYFQLWYLCVMIWYLIILLLLNKKVSLKTATIISFRKS